MVTDEQQLRERLLALALNSFTHDLRFAHAWAEECFDYVMSGKLSEAARRAYEGRQK